MAHFYGTIKGTRGVASRMGSKDSGLCTQAAGWEGCIKVNVYHNDVEHVDWYEVWLTPWQGSPGRDELLKEGPLRSLERTTK